MLQGLRRSIILLSGLIILATLSSACNPLSAAKEDAVLKIGLIPILDTIPIYVAQDKGYFQAEGIKVEVVPAKSAQERDALMQAGEIDGQLNDLISAALLDKEKSLVKVLVIARKAYPNSPQFRILAGPNSGIKSAKELAGVPIGISHNTIIEYISDRMLGAEGLKQSEITYEEVSAIPNRFELLMNNQLPAATLPDPMAQGAIAAGAKLIIDDSKYGDYSQSVLSFSLQALEKKPDTVRKFLRAWEKAVSDVNAQPDQFTKLLIEKGRVPESIQNSYKMPPFPLNEVTSETQWADIIAWLMEKKLISRPIAYSDAVDAQYLK